MDEVLRLELLLLEPLVRNDPDQVRQLLHSDFVEYGCSGRTWDRESVTEATSNSHEPIAAIDLRATRLGDEAVLLTYTSESVGRRALRSSIWVRERDCWVMLFHQGTSTE